MNHGFWVIRDPVCASTTNSLKLVASSLIGPGSIISRACEAVKMNNVMNTKDIIIFIMGEYLSKPDKTKHTESGESQ